MTREEISEAVSYIKTYRRLDENLHNAAPKGSEGFYATEKCLHYWDMAIKALEQEPCGKDINVPATDAISRQAVLDCQRFIYDETGEELEVILAENVLNLPPVTPQPKTGHWIKTKEQDNAEPLILWKCSECLTVQRLKTNYCPDCGAKMEGSEGKE